MWHDPTLAIDLTYLALVPYLDTFEIYQIPTDPAQLRHLTNEAVSAHDIPALIGALTLWFAKASQQNLKREYPIVHLANFDRLFYLLSERSMQSHCEAAFHRALRLVVQRWVKESQAGKVGRMLGRLKEETHLLEKVLQYVREDKGEKTLVVKQVLKVFSLELGEGNKEGFDVKLSQHGEFIHKNRKDLFLLKAVYEVEFLALRHLTAHHLSIQDIAKLLENKLLLISQVARFSVSLEVLAFLMRKLLLIRRHLPKDHYSDLLLRVETTIDKNQVTRLNLQQKTEFFAFHMLHNHYFHYLHLLFKNAHPSQRELVTEWKRKIRTAIEGSVGKEQRQIGQPEIDETVFYMQLREKQDQVEFPDLGSRTVKRTLTHSIFSDVSSAEQCMIAVAKNFYLRGVQEMQAVFPKLNLIEQALFIHSAAAYQAALTHPASLQSLPRCQLAQLITAFFNSLSNPSLLQMIHFFLISIQLGNFYPTPQTDASVTLTLYDMFIDTLHFRLMNSLTDYRQLSSSDDLLQIRQMHGYLLALIPAISGEVIYICRDCGQKGEGEKCQFCQSICSGIKLGSQESQGSGCGKDSYFYGEMLENWRQKVRETYRCVYADSQESNTQWIHMLLHLMLSLVF